MLVIVIVIVIALGFRTSAMLHVRSGAFNLATGEELWKARLPAGPRATRMIYTGADGRQYVVITAGGHGAFGARYGDHIIAYALPR